MYNRYIPGDDGAYRRIPMPEPVPERYPPPPPPKREEKAGVLSSLIQRFRLTELDTSDLLLLAVIFLLFKESEDEELLLILALLLVL